MAHVRSHRPVSHQRTLLLREVAALLHWELEAVSSRKWSCFSRLKRQKALLAGRLRKLDWSDSGPVARPVAQLLARIDRYRRELEEMKLGYAPVRVR